MPEEGAKSCSGFPEKDKSFAGNLFWLIRRDFFVLQVILSRLPDWFKNDFK